MEQEKTNLVEHVKTKKNKRRESDHLHLKECFVEKWTEYLSVNDELVDQKKCHDDIEKEIMKLQNDLDLAFRQKELSAAGRAKSKIDGDMQKHKELLENKLHVVRLLRLNVYVIPTYGVERIYNHLKRVY